MSGKMCICMWVSPANVFVVVVDVTHQSCRSSLQKLPSLITQSIISSISVFVVAVLNRYHSSLLVNLFKNETQVFFACLPQISLFCGIVPTTHATYLRMYVYGPQKILLSIKYW